MLHRLKLILDMIRFEHSVFALPFAFMGALLGAAPDEPSLPSCAWILLAMVGARSAAMAFNRLVDAPFDATNPRTRARALVTGALRKGEVILFTANSAALFLFAAAMLNRLALILAFPALAVLFLYSYTKRFTTLSHLVLGICLGATPLAGWVAVTGSLRAEPLFLGLSAVPAVLGLGVCFWVTGFDLIYACQDVDHDKREGLFSIPARLGVTAALVLSASYHALSFALFCLTGALAELGYAYWAGMMIVLVSLVVQHAIVRPGDLSKVRASFFTANGVISLAMALATWISL